MQKLGFSTDNGAYYYYHTDDNDTKTAEQVRVSSRLDAVCFVYTCRQLIDLSLSLFSLLQTLVDVQKYGEKVWIPYAYILLDSWW